jgi:membrane associated rhomboid family serine protease
MGSRDETEASCSPGAYIVTVTTDCGLVHEEPTQSQHGTTPITIAMRPPSSQEETTRSTKGLQKLWRITKDQFADELAITGDQVWRCLRPRRIPGQHRPIFTLTACAVWCLIFVMMTGQYDVYKALSSAPALACMQGNAQIGIQRLWHWILPGNYNWCYSRGGTFSTAFLIDWGAKWTPQLHAQPYRWVTSCMIHLNFMHLFANAMVFITLSTLMEAHHGALRMAAFFIFGSIGGNAWSAVLENPCTAVAGSSGGICGLGGAFLLEMVFRWNTIRRPLLRILMLLCFIILFAIATALDSSSTSHMSHIGGLVSGALVAMILLPPKEAGLLWKVTSCAVGVVSLTGMIASMMCIFYLQVHPASINLCSL